MRKQEIAFWDILSFGYHCSLLGTGITSAVPGWLAQEKWQHVGATEATLQWMHVNSAGPQVSLSQFGDLLQWVKVESSHIQKVSAHAV